MPFGTGAEIHNPVAFVPCHNHHTYLAFEGVRPDYAGPSLTRFRNGGFVKERPVGCGYIHLPGVFRFLAALYTTLRKPLLVGEVFENAVGGEAVYEGKSHVNHSVSKGPLFACPATPDQ